MYEIEIVDGKGMKIKGPAGVTREDVALPEDVQIGERRGKDTLSLPKAVKRGFLYLKVRHFLDLRFPVV